MQKYKVTGIQDIDTRLAQWCNDHHETLAGVENCSGGSINQARLLTTGKGSRYFLKFSTDARLQGAFSKERLALEKLAAPGVISVPCPLLAGDGFLLMTAFTGGRAAPDWQEQTGRSLALLHEATPHDRYGFECDNLLGFSHQSNCPDIDWVRFWREQRLLPQLQILAADTGHNDPLLQSGYRLAEALDDIIGHAGEAPVLLHGDLWSGNAAADESGNPVIFDPASWYGSGEVEFGMMRMFGGFGVRCEAAYAEIRPFAAEHDRRIAVYRLYHELNHLILFGGSYYSNALQTLRSVL